MSVKFMSRQTIEMYLRLYLENMGNMNGGKGSSFLKHYILMRKKVTYKLYYISFEQIFIWNTIQPMIWWAKM